MQDEFLTVEMTTIVWKSFISKQVRTNGEEAHIARIEEQRILNGSPMIMPLTTQYVFELDAKTYTDEMFKGVVMFVMDQHKRATVKQLDELNRRYVSEIDSPILGKFRRPFGMGES